MGAGGGRPGPTGPCFFNWNLRSSTFILLGSNSLSFGSYAAWTSKTSQAFGESISTKPETSRLPLGGKFCAGRQVCASFALKAIIGLMKWAWTILAAGFISISWSPFPAMADFSLGPLPIALGVVPKTDGCVGGPSGEGAWGFFISCWCRVIICSKDGGGGLDDKPSLLAIFLYSSLTITLRKDQVDCAKGDGHNAPRILKTRRESTFCVPKRGNSSSGNSILQSLWVITQRMLIIDRRTLFSRILAAQ